MESAPETMLPSARRAALEEKMPRMTTLVDFDNGFLSRRALAEPLKRVDTVMTTATDALSMDDIARADEEFTVLSDDDAAKGRPKSRPRSHRSASLSTRTSAREGRGKLPPTGRHKRGGSEERSDMMSGNRVLVRANWRLMEDIENLVLEVKGNKCQCQRLGARLGALERPMAKARRTKRTGDVAMILSIKDILTASHRFLSRFVDENWWKGGVALEEDYNIFDELTSRVSKILKAPPGYRTQVEEEDKVDRWRDFESTQATLEAKLEREDLWEEHEAIATALHTLRVQEAAQAAIGYTEIDQEQLQYGRIPKTLGSGSFGTVVEATWFGTKVAVKKLNLHPENLTKQNIDNLRKEIRLHQSLQFEFVIQMYGACSVRPNLYLVTQLAPFGSLYAFLHSSKSMPREEITLEEKVAMLHDIARGMQFLHSKGILHRDLKSSNVLIFENRRLKVCDFGIARVKELSCPTGVADNVGQTAWVAPEVLDDEEPTERSDIYSFGMIVHETITQRIPFAGKSMAKIIAAVLTKGLRPGFGEGEEEALPDGVVRLMDICWAQDPEARPADFGQVVVEVNKIGKRLGGDPRCKALQMGVSSGREGDEEMIRELENQIRLLKEKGHSNKGDAVTSSGTVAHPPIPPVSTVGETPNGRSMFDEGEREVLRTFFQETGGTRWWSRRGWETDEEDVSGWHGVTVSGAHVVALRLRGNNLDGHILRELGLLTHLRCIDLSENNLTGTIPPSLARLSRLEDLNLSHNALHGAIPEDLANCISLRKFSINFNKISGNLPRAMSTLPKLRDFEVDWHKIGATFPFRHFQEECRKNYIRKQQGGTAENLPSRSQGSSQGSRSPQGSEMSLDISSCSHQSFQDSNSGEMPLSSSMLTGGSKKKGVFAVIKRGLKDVLGADNLHPGYSRG
ncbi:unnamed protein product [Discosporangium mesarthrocarpum]